MALLKCKMCGGDLVLNEESTVAQCEFCGTQQTVPTADNEKKITLFQRANRLRFACEFDKAAGIYESIVAEFPEEAEAYWGLVLCKYGIEYVDDPATAKKIPTCHRSSFDSVMDDSNFELVLENADPAARGVYRNEAKQIEELRKSIIEVSSKEEPYDIFICYKETAADGDRTIDSVIAQDVYDALTEKGYRVFFSRITLEDKLGQEYEPYIFAALNSAKIMLAFGTDYEYYNAVWVKNEWSRFLQLIAKGEKKTLIPCYKNIDAYDMPKEFAKLQAQDMGKVGAIQDLLRGIEKILPKHTETIKETVKETVVVQQSASNATTDSLLKRAFMFLEDGKWESADEYCEKVLDIDPECAKAYLGKLMAELKIKINTELEKHNWYISNNDHFKKALRFADDDLSKFLNDCEAAIAKRLEEERILKEKQEKEALAAKAKREEEERIAKEKHQIENKNKLRTVREKIAPVQNLITADNSTTIGLMCDGTLVVTRKLCFIPSDDSNGIQFFDISDWRDIVAVCAGGTFAVGLKPDGTVVAKGVNNYGQCDVNNWRNIIAISAGQNTTAGLKSDGTVVATGWNKYGECNVSGWKDIVAVSAGKGFTIGLKSDGTVLAVGDNHFGQCNVEDWKDIVAISAGFNHTVGLKDDGTVIAVGNSMSGKCRVSKWTDIVAVSAGMSHTVGLKSDGTVVVASENFDGEGDVKHWQNVVAISAGWGVTLGLKSYGEVVAVGSNTYHNCETSGWKLFDNIDTFKEESAAARKKRAEEDEKIKQEQEQKQRQKLEWRTAGKCQRCGGELKGLITKKCVACGKKKDY